MTYHGLEGQLCAAVVGFDYQRTMVAAAAALLGLFTSTAPQGVITSTPPQRPRPHTLQLKQGQQQQSQLQQPQQPPPQPHSLAFADARALLHDAMPHDAPPAAPHAQPQA